MWYNSVLDVTVGLKLEIDQKLTVKRMVGDLTQHIQVILAIIARTDKRKRPHWALKWEAQIKTILNHSRKHRNTDLLYIEYTHFESR